METTKCQKRWLTLASRGLYQGINQEKYGLKFKCWFAVSWYQQGSNVWQVEWRNGIKPITLSAMTCSKLTIETLEQGAK